MDTVPLYRKRREEVVGRLNRVSDKCPPGNEINSQIIELCRLLAIVLKESRDPEITQVDFVDAYLNLISRIESGSVMDTELSGLDREAYQSLRQSVHFAVVHAMGLTAASYAGPYLELLKEKKKM